MTYQELVALAAHEQPLPLFQSLPDRLCYDCLVCLKEEYDRGKLDEKRVRARKLEIRRAHQEAAEAFRQYMAVCKEYNDHRVMVGQYIQAILKGMKDPKPDYRALLLTALDCIGTLENDDTAVRKIREAVELSDQPPE